MYEQKERKAGAVSPALRGRRGEPVSEDELEEKQPGEDAAALLEKALDGKLSPRVLSRSRDALLREALRNDRADALPCLMPKRRMELSQFREVLAWAEDGRCPASTAWLLAYRQAHYSPAEFDEYEQRQLDLELGLAEPKEAELRKRFRLRYLREGVCICGVREQRSRYEIPERIGGKPVVGVDAAAFYSADPMPRVRRHFPGDTEAPRPEGLRTGDRLLLGRCMDGKGTAETPLSWRVLCREEGRSLVLCERPVAVLPYHRELQEVCWESCDLRYWLNTVFLPLCFSERERAAILATRVETPDNPNFGTPGGDASEDRLFLLSAEEAAGLPDGEDTRALGRWWWLRTPGFDNSFAATVTPDGAIVRIGSFVDTDDYAVRPAMWIKS